MKKNIIILTAFTELLTLQGWFVCQRFTDIFHFGSIDVVFQLGTYINAFKGKPFWLIRLFHNKLVQDPINFLRVYLQFWDVRFGINWFSLIGYFGIFAGFYYIISNKKKKMYHWFVLSMLIIFPCIEILLAPQVSLQIKSIYLWLPFTVFSLYGIYQFLSYGNFKKRVWIIVSLLIISMLWIFFLPFNISNYCVHYPIHPHVRKP